MARESIIYDLVLLLSRTATDEDRERILTEVENTIANGGGLLEHQIDWGTRPMTYEIRHQGEAEYHVLQFSGPPSLLETLSHSLRIADTVLRFRIIKVLPGTPPAPDSAPPVLAAANAAGSAPSGGESAE
jgi:small subunit ribosomal protein S6